MKKSSINLLLSAFLLLTAAAYAQPESPAPLSKQEKARLFLNRYLTMLDTSKNKDANKAIIRGIENVAEGAPADWIAQYHAAYQNAIIGSSEKDSALAAFTFNKAQRYLSNGLKLKPEESELVLLDGMIRSMMLAKKSEQDEKTKTEIMQRYEKAKNLNKNNPRVWLVLGQTTLDLPEEKGGGKKPAQQQLETALKLYETDKHEDPAWPKWGKDTTEWLLKFIKGDAESEKAKGKPESKPKKK